MGGTEKGRERKREREREIEVDNEKYTVRRRSCLSIQIYTIDEEATYLLVHFVFVVVDTSEPSDHPVLDNFHDSNPDPDRSHQHPDFELQQFVPVLEAHLVMMTRSLVHPVDLDPYL